jgi:transposase-like protein/IS1 family transposase
VNCHCCSGPAKRFGRFENKNRIVQRYRCTRCGKTFSEDQPLAGLRVEDGKTVQVVKMLCEGLGVRSTARLSGVEKKTVLNILRTAGEHCAQFMDDKIRNLKPEPVEVDECWSFVGHHRMKGNTPEKGDFYAYLASGRDTKLILSYITGKRDYEVSEDLITDLRSRVGSRFQITSDGWQGFIRGVLDNNENDKMDYAVQIKKYESTNPADGPRRYSTGKCISVQTIKVCGTPEWGNISTSHAERLNLSLRHFNKRFTRLSPCFSKKAENLAHSVSLTVAFFNFCRVHKSLKIKADGDAKAIERTPAMAAALTDHVWTVSELLAATL